MNESSVRGPNLSQAQGAIARLLAIVALLGIGLWLLSSTWFQTEAGFT